MTPDQDLPPDQIAPLALRHNFWTWSAQAEVNPIPVVRSEGVRFWDASGKSYLDFNSMMMCSNIGHGNTHVIEAIVRQARELPFAAPAMATKPRAILGQMLAEICPGDLGRFLYTLGGAEATENAIKLARAATGRHKILARYRCHRRPAALGLGAAGHAGRRPLLRPVSLSLRAASRRAGGRRSDLHSGLPASARGDDPARGPADDRRHPCRDRHRDERRHHSSGGLPAGCPRAVRSLRHPAHL